MALLQLTRKLTLPAAQLQQAGVRGGRCGQPECAEDQRAPVRLGRIERIAHRVCAPMSLPVVGFCEGCVHAHLTLEPTRSKGVEPEFMRKTPDFTGQEA